MAESKPDTDKVPEDQESSRPQARDTSPTGEEAARRPALPRLALPKGALLAVRKSGAEGEGVRELVIYPDGRLTRSMSEKPDQRGPRTLNDAQVARLRHTLEQSDFFRLESAAGQTIEQTPGYEIAARLGGRINDVVYGTGSIPRSLAPLIAEIEKFLPEQKA